MRTEQRVPVELKRVNFNLPISLHNELSRVVRERSLTMTDALRSAIAFWLEHEIAEEMAEGYRVTAKENLELLKEFEIVDQETW